MAALLSIGIPAYDRPQGLERAARSVLAQTHADLELIVSDDASPNPAVARLGERLAAEDGRVRFARQPQNLGHVGNYRWVLEAARGEYFMWLADDDWLDPAYASRCLEELRTDPRRRLVCGQARYHPRGAPAIDERPVDLDARRPGVRVVGYFARVNMNGPLFGVARRADLAEVGFPDVVGGDWLLVAELAARGHVRTLRDVHVHRSMEGIGGDGERLARSFGLRGPLARWHHVWVAWNVLWRGRPGRAAAVLSALIVFVRYPVVLSARAAGLGGIEDRAVAWMRARRR